MKIIKENRDSYRHENNNKFMLEFDMGNDAFQGGNSSEECARYIRRVADNIERGALKGKVSDINGNSIGSWSIQ